MTAKDLIRTANQKGIAVARRKPGIYQYWTGGNAPTDFVGTFHEFCKFITAK